MSARSPKPPDSFGAGNRSKSDQSSVILALSIEQACGALNVSWKTWHEMIEPEIKLLRLGRAKRVPVIELERWIERHAENVLERR